MSRTIRANVYFAEPEMQKIARKVGVNFPVKGQRDLKKVGAFIRAAALNKEVNQIDPVCIEQFQQLARLSSNLNQLSYLNNQNKELNLSSLKTLLVDIRNSLLNIKGGL